MSQKQENATKLFKDGYNCAQAVFATFCEDYGVCNELAFKIAAGLGSGVRHGEICGAVSGAVLVIGLKYGETKANCNLKTEEFLSSFKKAEKSIVCRELLSCDIATPFGRETAVNGNLFNTKCVNLVISAVSILEKLGY